ncbi:MAG: FAD-binding oxidoreductase [Sphingomonas sp.]|nr:FAD-binding oxidoreductase [Sphingomonas sp.]
MKTSDILVIGGGVAGLSAAAALSKHARVTVLEAEEQVGYHSSGRSAALLHYALGNPTIRRLTQASRQFFEDPPEELGEVTLSSTLPILTPARENELDGLRSLAGDLSPFTHIDWLDEEGLRRECPVLRIGADGAVQGFIDRTALKLDGHALLQSFLRLLRRRGGEVRTDARIQSIHRTGSSWQVLTERGEQYETPLLINAAGAWADAVATLAGAAPVGLQPKRRTIIVFDAPADIDPSRLPFTKTVPDELYFGPEAGRVFASPMDEVPTDPCDARPEEYEMALAADRIEQRTTMTVRRIEHRWAGLRTFAPDRLPVVGFAPEVEGFFWLAGQGGAGLQTAPAMAAVVESLVSGAASPVPGLDPATLSPARFLAQHA